MIIMLDKIGIMVEFDESFFNGVLGSGICVFYKNFRWFVCRMILGNIE